MSRITCTQLREKDVINLCDGTRLGYISEIEFDTCNGQICAVILSRACGFFGFSKDAPIFIPWSRIECIGEDAVLVKISDRELEDLCCDKKKRPKGARECK